MKQNEHLFDKESLDINVTPNFAYFIAAPVVLDTHYFSKALLNKKWQEQDEEAHQWILKSSDIG